MKTNLIENRQIRIFISSTFRDMQSERNYLVDKIFPTLKRYCQERDVTLIELDLRWGISEDASKQGKALEICLQEIDNTHPFFIGLLGYRYGSMPSPEEITKNPQILERYSLIKSYLSDGRSFTDIEMQYGALHFGDANAYFYLRSPGVVVPKDFKEEAGSKEESKLNLLKEQIGSQDKYPVRNYTSNEELGRQVEADLKEMTDALFPQGRLSEVERERLLQKAFLKSRTGVYIPDPENDRQLNNFMTDDSSALVITGASGMGKSALIANWITANEGKMNGKLIYHFVGNSGLEGDYRKITQRLINEIKWMYELLDKKDELEALSNTPSVDSDKQKEELQKLLLSIAVKEPLLIILDGINQLAERDNAKLLTWLPTFPQNVKVIYSTLPNDATMTVFKRRGYDVFTLQPLDVEKREELIRIYLKSYGKSLSPVQIKRIASDKECENTLVLRTLLDELRVFGEHEEIDHRIDDYLSAASILLFFDKVLTRIESSYNYNDITNFVGDVFSLIAVSRAGLSETELLKLTGAPPLYWVQLYHAVASHLTVKNGLITFSHSYFRESILKRYLSPQNEQTYRNRIVAYCEKELLQGNSSSRIYDEFPYQLHQSHRYERLYSFLLNFGVFDYINNKDIYELGKYWRALINENKEKYQLRMYLELKTNNWEERDIAGLYNNIGNFIGELSWDDSLALEYKMKNLAINERVLGTNHPDTATSYNSIGTTYYSMGNYPKALEYHLKALAICERVGTDHPTTATFYNNIGLAYDSMRDYPKALEYHLKALAIREHVLGNRHPHTANSYNNIGLAYNSMKGYPKALEYYLKALDIRERILGNRHPRTANSYNNIGLAYDYMRDYPKALEFYLKAIAIYERVLGTEHSHTANSYNNIGSTYNSIGNYPKALEYHLKALAICERVGTDHPTTATFYNNIGSVYKSMGDYPKALEYLLKALAICERVLGTDHFTTAMFHSNIGYIYESMGNHSKASEYYLKALAARRR
ncbi:MAG: tetratricopeptide repeat protein [Tannerella sp.]|jgi:tetratricopeptide (TPR) repeat protein|nr:tetratricopeptide repeat protein [Tannerella sp.]